jgi:hypothetical protein
MNGESYRRATSKKAQRRSAHGQSQNPRYEWSSEHRRCKEAPLAMNEYCYRPTAFFSRLLFE